MLDVLLSRGDARSRSDLNVQPGPSLKLIRRFSDFSRYYFRVNLSLIYFSTLVQTSQEQSYVNQEKVFAIMEERGQSCDGERSDHGFDSGEHRSCGHNSMKYEAKQDRISDMTDEILLRMLSFLPIKDAIKTGMLSHRWLYLWTSVPTIYFSGNFWALDPTVNFVTFVDKTLLSLRPCRVNKFVVKFHYNDLYACRVDTWVRFATSANVEELCLALSSQYDYYVLPQHVYTNSLITTLTLTRCNVAPNELISWKSLKSLLIGYTNLSEDVIQKILVGAPLLESLELFGCCGFNRLDIGSSSLRKLVLRNLRDYNYQGRKDDSALEISAPNLQSLGMVGKMYRKKFWLMNIQSLDDCYLNFEKSTHDEDYDNDFEEQRNMVGEILDRLRHVKKLTMGNWCIQVLSILELRDILAPVSECKCLILHTYIMKCDVPGIVSLLKSYLNLETLVIDMNSLYGLNSLFELECEVEDVLENYLTSESESSECLLLHLKTVKIVNFVARHEFGLVIPLLQFLLEKGRTLEKIVINTRRGNFMECSQEESLLVAQKFLSYSPHVVVSFQNDMENS